jgi:Protein of unknown function (DUF1573)
MKHLNTVLLALIVLGLGVNFMMDFKRDKAMQAIALLAAPKPAPIPAEPSPFDNIAKDPLHDTPNLAKGAVTEITFARTEHDFRTIEEGGIYKTSFKYTNTGKENLLISNAIGSCGCTVPSWSTKPLKPDESDEMQVEFDTKGKLGEQIKTVTVTTNTEPSTHQVMIKALVVRKK